MNRFDRSGYYEPVTHRYHQEKVRHVRRVVATGLAAAIVGGGGIFGASKLINLLQQSHQSATSTSSIGGTHELPPFMPPNSPTPHLESTKTPPVKKDQPTEGMTQWFGKSQIVYDQDRIPLKYVSENGQSYDIRQAALAAKSQAIKSGEYEIVDLGISTEYNSPYKTQPRQSSAEHPVTTQDPVDALTTSELKNRGIEIIQSPDGTSLSIRPQAFDKDGLLAKYQPGGKGKLEIVLVPGPVVSRDYLSDSRYDQYRDLLRENQSILDLDQKKSDMLASLDKEISEIRKKIVAEKTKPNQDPDKISSLNEILLTVKSEKIRYGKYKDADWVNFFGKPGESNYGGLYFPPERFNGTAVIFLAVQPIDIPDQDSLEIDVDPQGNFRVHMVTVGGQHYGASIKPTDTYPSPDDFNLNPEAASNDPTSYPYGAQEVGQALRHEQAHDVLINVGKGKTPNYSEYDTDMAAMNTIQKAWTTWKNSGFVDNSGYYFVFRTPNGEYIYTMNEPTTPNSFSAQVIKPSKDNLIRQKQNVKNQRQTQNPRI